MTVAAALWDELGTAGAVATTLVETEGAEFRVERGIEVQVVLRARSRDLGIGSERSFFEDETPYRETAVVLEDPGREREHDAPSDAERIAVYGLGTSAAARDLLENACRSRGTWFGNDSCLIDAWKRTGGAQRVMRFSPSYGEEGAGPPRSPAHVVLVRPWDVDGGSWNLCEEHEGVCETLLAAPHGWLGVLSSDGCCTLQSVAHAASGVGEHRLVVVVDQGEVRVGWERG